MKFLSTCALLFICLGTVQASQPLNSIVAIVNDDIILESELRNREAMIIQQLQQQNAKLPPRDALQRQVLERLALENLQLQLAKSSGIQVDDEMLNANLRTMAKQNEMSLDEFREAIEKDGYSYIAFREQLRNQITISRIRKQMVDNRIQVTEKEIDNLLANAAANRDQDREYRLSHILISTPEAATPAQIKQEEARANEVLARLKAGEDFQQVAITESDGHQALTGGDLGWRKTGQLPSFFSDVIGQLQKGQISNLIRSPSGFHIVEITDIRGDERHLIHQTRARHILLKTDELTSESEVKTRLQQLRARILQGEDFATLARANSQDPGSGSDGGSLGWVSPGEMVPEFETAMDELPVGQVSELIKSRFGWHLILVTERRQHDDTEEHQRTRARESIHELKTHEELEIWLRRLRDESYVEYLSND